MRFFLWVLVTYLLSQSSVIQAAEGFFSYSNLSPQDPLAPAFLFTSHNSIRHGIPKNLNLAPLSPRMPIHELDQSIAPLSSELLEPSADCNLESMLALGSPAALVDYLKGHSYSCLSFLWTYTPTMKKLFTTTNLLAIQQEVASLSNTYTGTDSNHILELVFFIRVAYYQDFYHPMGFDKIQLKPLMASTLSAFFSNLHSMDNTDAAGVILNEALNCIDVTEVPNELMPALEKALQLFLEQINPRLALYNQRLSLFSMLSIFSRGITNKVISSVSLGLINTLSHYSTLRLQESYSFVTNNAIWVLAQIADKIAPSRAAALRAIEAAYRDQPQWSEEWLWTVRALTLRSDCASLSSGDQVCLSQVRTQLKAVLFPKTYRYENETFIAKTALPQTEIEPLYFATLEVKSQFARILGHLTPVPNDPNPVLNLIIYKSPSDYSKYHTFLFNLDSNNGGIYIEQQGTYYTYQRSASQSIYTLQELARHEYSHYLIERFVVPGMWGETPIYNNNRMVFFDEGLAEFLAGSSSREGILMRKSLVSQIKSDGNSRLSIAQTLSSTYGDFKFYRYAGMFFHFLANQHLDSLKELLNIANRSDPATFDSWIRQMKTNADLNTEYQQYLNAAVQNLSQIETPTTIAPTTDQLVYSQLNQIRTILIGTHLMDQVNCTLSASQTNVQFTCQGNISGDATSVQDPTLGWFSVNQKLNQLMKASLQPSVTNFNWMTCWMRPIQWNGSTLPTSQVTCEGPLATGSPDPTPPQPDAYKKIQEDFRKTRLGKNTTCTQTANTVTCRVPSSTSLFPTSTSEPEMIKVMEADVATLRTDVFNLDRTYYSKLTCQLNEASIKYVNYTVSQKYALFEAACATPVN